MGEGKIYLRDGDDLVEMTQARYEKEIQLQQLIAERPALLGGEQIDPVSPRRWLLVAEEIEIPDTEDGAGRWYLDLFFLDQDGIPTLVEVKRSTDTRIRREVVAQMLDYAANITAYMPATEMRSRYEARCVAEGLNPTVELLTVTGGGTLDTSAEEAESAVDDYWGRVARNLKTQRLRLIYLADEIPRSLQRIVTFLNEGLAATDVLAVEVPQYVAGSRQVLVPRVIGWTFAAEDTKRVSGKRVREDWTDETFFDALGERAGADAVRLPRGVLAWTASHGHPHYFGHGRGGPLYIQALDANREPVTILDFYADGKLELPFHGLRKHSPDVADPILPEMHRRLSAIPGASFGVEKSWPTIPPDALSASEAYSAVMETVEWLAAELADISQVERD